MLWFKALHLIFMVAWFAGLFYLPRLFIYHSMSQDLPSIERFKLMEWRLFYAIMTPAGILTVLAGVATLFAAGWDTYRGYYWLPIKLGCVLFLIAYHLYCGVLLVDFRHGRNRHSALWYRWFNEIPVLFLIVIVLLAVLRPF